MVVSWVDISCDWFAVPRKISIEDLRLLLVGTGGEGLILEERIIVYKFVAKNQWRASLQKDQESSRGGRRRGRGLKHTTWWEGNKEKQEWSAGLAYTQQVTVVSFLLSVKLSNAVIQSIHTYHRKSRILVLNLSNYCQPYDLRRHHAEVFNWLRTLSLLITR